MWSKNHFRDKKKARIERESEILNEQKTTVKARKKMLNQLSEDDIIIKGGKGSKTAAGVGIKNNKILRGRVIREAINAETPIYAEDLRNAYKSCHIKKYGELYDVVIHGESYYVEYEHKYNLDVETLAWIISGRRDYKGENIRLISCNTGKPGADGNCFAQQLANKLRVIVYAPEDITYIKPYKITVGDHEEGFPIGFKKFEPK